MICCCFVPCFPHCKINDPFTDACAIVSGYQFKGIFDENGLIKSYLSDLVIDCTKQRTDIDPDEPVTPRPANASPNPIIPSAAAVPVPQTKPVLPQAPIYVVAPAPAKSPLVLSAPTTATVTPVNSPMAPVVAPPTANAPAPVVADPVVPTTHTASVPSATLPTPTIASPTLFTSPDTLPSVCEQNSVCNALGLTGACCPTIDGWTLDCCTPGDQTVEVQCQNNVQCATLGLVDACCPTKDGQYLDCCAAVPDDCQAAGACEVVSALEYKATNGLQLSAAARAISTGNQAIMWLVVLAGASSIAIPFFLF